MSEVQRIRRPQPGLGTLDTGNNSTGNNRQLGAGTSSQGPDLHGHDRISAQELLDRASELSEGLGKDSPWRHGGILGIDLIGFSINCSKHLSTANARLNEGELGKAIDALEAAKPLVDPHQPHFRGDKLTDTGRYVGLCKRLSEQLKGLSGQQGSSGEPAQQQGGAAFAGLRREE